MPFEFDIPVYFATSTVGISFDPSAEYFTLCFPTLINFLGSIVGNSVLFQNPSENNSNRRFEQAVKLLCLSHI